MRKWPLIIISLFTFLFLTAQEFGGHPPSAKWSQVETDSARVIFPQGYDSIAKKVAGIIHHLQMNNQPAGNKLRKINIVLQNQTTIANGYVGLGPYRSEFLMTPSMNGFELGSTDWPVSLALHEWRHVQQYNNFNTGLSRVMGILFGEEGLALSINASVPDWFYEGDAVYNETIYSGQGRGRIPFFTNQYPSLWRADKKYSWMKLRNGSMKHFVPSHYHLGYLLVNYGYEKYGADFWDKVTREAAAFKKLFYPFQAAIRKYTGNNYRQFISEAFDFYKKNDTPTDEINKMTSGTEEFPQQVITKNNIYLTDYYIPYRLGADSLLYLKKSYRNRAAFMIRTGGFERILRIKDISLDEHYSYRNGKIVYAAYKPDLRWAWRDYSEIRVMDISTSQQKTLTRKSKYFTPDISEDGSRVAAVHYDANSDCELHILNTETGQVINRISDNEISLLTDPKFLNNDQVVVCSRMKDGRMTLLLIDTRTSKMEQLLPLTFNVIGFPNVENDKIYFTRTYKGNDELFYIQLPGRQIFRLTDTDLGNYFVSVSGSTLHFSSFTANGYRIMKYNAGKDIAQPVTPSEWESEGTQFKVAGQHENNFYRLRQAGNSSFNVNKYKKGTGLLNFHSWRPYYEDPIFTFSLYGENILNTLQTELYYLYNQNENTSAAGFSTVFGGLFPYISAGSEFTFSRTDTLNNLTRRWNQLDSRVGLNVPLNFSGGRFFRFLNFGSSYVLRVENNTGPTKNMFAENTFSYLSHFFSYSQQTQQAVQHILPKLGFELNMQHRHTITDFDSYQYNGAAEIFLPGFFSTHGIALQAAFQQRDTFRIVFSSRLPYARGYNELHFSRMWKLGGEYHFPLWIPDWGFANILFIQRIRAAGFYDFQKVYSRNKQVTRDQRSVGTEIYFDTKWWNQYPLSFGFRISKRLDTDLLTGQRGVVVEFILPVSIIPR